MIERLKILRRDYLKLNQSSFSNKINLKQNSYSNIENGKVALTERNIKTICEVFNVNEEWLRNGTEPIFIEKDDEPLIDLIQKEFDLSPLSKKIVNSYLNLDKQNRVVFERCFTNLLDEISNDNNTLNDKPQPKLIGFGGDNKTNELNQEQANLNIQNINIEDNDL